MVLNAPESFQPELDALTAIQVLDDPSQAKSIDYFLAFVIDQNAIEINAIIADELTKGDSIVWFAYPKQSSKTYQVEINRDRGWRALQQKGFAPVRQVSIDGDWSALRFRRTQFIGKS